MASTSDIDYIFDNDDELTRLALQHIIIKDAMQGELVRAPLDFTTDEPLHILDACTGDGLWIRDLQKSIAPHGEKHTYMGTDLNPAYFPTDTPANISYQVQDIKAPWPADWKAKFDLVHQRLAIVVPGNDEATLACLRAYVNLLKPGGWIQLVEVRKWVKDSDGQAFKDLNVCLDDMIKTIGANLEHIDHAKGWLETLGLDNINEAVVEANYGTREDKKVQEIAKRSILTTAGSILAVMAQLPPQMLSLPNDRIEGIQEGLEKQFDTDPVSAHWQYKIVWGRKPL